MSQIIENAARRGFFVGFVASDRVERELETKRSHSSP